jgi:hypothetical protein
MIAHGIKAGTIALIVACAAISAQTPSPPVNEPHGNTGTSASPVSAAQDNPLPDIPTLMRSVEANQRKSEAVQKDYIFRSVETQQELDSHGQAKKTTVTESEHFWVNGVPVRRMVKKDGKPLSPDEIAKENERIDKIAAKANERRDKADAEGKETDPRGNEEVTVSRLLELGAFTNPRRVQLNGRDTIAVDFTGDPKAKTRNRAEEVIRDLAGTAWIDEQDCVLARVEGHFVNSFKIGGGLIASVQKDTRFSMTQIKVNDEVWLPSRLEGQGSFHALLFFGFSGKGEIVTSDYRKFRTRSKILPGTTQVTPSPGPNGPSQP